MSRRNFIYGSCVTCDVMISCWIRASGVDGASKKCSSPGIEVGRAGQLETEAGEEAMQRGGGSSAHRRLSMRRVSEPSNVQAALGETRDERATCKAKVVR